MSSSEGKAVGVWPRKRPLILDSTPHCVELQGERVCDCVCLSGVGGVSLPYCLNVIKI